MYQAANVWWLEAGLPSRADLAGGDPGVAPGLRAGGAAYSYLYGRSVEQLMWRGRWETLTSVKHYVQASASTLATVKLPPEAVQRVGLLVRNLGAVLHSLTMARSGTGGLDD